MTTTPPPRFLWVDNVTPPPDFLGVDNVTPPPQIECEPPKKARFYPKKLFARFARDWSRTAFCAEFILVHVFTILFLLLGQFFTASMIRKTALCVVLAYIRSFSRKPSPGRPAAKHTMDKNPMTSERAGEHKNASMELRLIAEPRNELAM